VPTFDDQQSDKNGETGMRINMELGRRVVIETETLDWVDSPAKGVQRRMLDREAAETGRATSLVRYAPDSFFPAHTHTGGEEYLVLEGIFSDEGGDQGPGMYVRNPVGSSHRPFTKEGCIILVKLWQMDAADQDFVRIDTARPDGWRPGAANGLTVRELHTFGAERVSLSRWRPGTRYEAHDHPGGEEILVLDGSLADEDGHYPKGAWLRLPPGSRHQPFSDEGCTLYVKTGHLETGAGA
jgi:anti-sigma factor ChrR (cupin superfamily)